MTPITQIQLDQSGIASGLALPAQWCVGLNMLLVLAPKLYFATVFRLPKHLARPNPPRPFNSNTRSYSFDSVTKSTRNRMDRCAEMYQNCLRCGVITCGKSVLTFGVRGAGQNAPSRLNSVSQCEYLLPIAL